MMWVLMCIIAIMIGLMMYSSIENELPDTLHLPKANKGQAVQPGTEKTTTQPFGPVASSSAQWQVRGDGMNVELVRDFQGRIDAQGMQYDAPTLIITCYNGEAFAGVNVHMAVADNAGKVAVRLNGAGQQWSVGNGHMLYSPTAKALIGQIRAEKAFSLTIPFAEIGKQTVQFNPVGGAKATGYLAPSCR